LKTHNINEINGQQLFDGFLFGAKKIFDNQNYINKINVFPVADADTGTNLASTFRAIVETAEVVIHLKTTADSIADAALTGARGNSGIIFAQFLYGFSNELPDQESISVKEYAYSMQKAVRYAYEAVAHPVEGTIITVIREWADSFHDILEKEDDFYHFFQQSLKRAKVSLKQTTKKMEKLSKAKVVDAGALGFVNFIEGITEYFKTGEILDANELKAAVIEFNDEHIDHDDITFRYCTEALIKGENLSKEKLTSILAGFGNSTVIAGSKRKMRIHIHTDTPWLLFEKLSKTSTLLAQKVDDMVLQNEIASQPKNKIALVTDSSCDLPKAILEKYQIQVIPLNIHFGETFYLDGISIHPDQFYKKLDTSRIYPTTSQPSFKDFYNRYNYLSSHYDSIIGIQLSAKLSGTWQNSLNAANKVAEQTGKTIEVINSKKLSSALGLIVLRAARAIEQGKTHDEIVALLPSWSLKTKQLASTETMKYLIKSGRVNASRGIIGRLLRIKPMLEVNASGLVIPFAKPISSKKSRNLLFSEMASFVNGKKVWGYALAHAENPETVEWLTRRLETIIGKPPEFVYSITPALATHTGIGAISLALMLE